ncbi:MAG: HlyD family efflux transporter periplasmic adaptor subunit [Rhodospirillaceae bacterium]|nr:HlyD family efflux transporter periplasmic adaptor subunit [Rhodospirillaceae bacterium]
MPLTCEISGEFRPRHAVASANRIGCFLALTAMLAAAGCDSTDSPLPAVGTLERDRVELIAEANEPIVEIAVSEGQAIEQGQLVLRLDDAFHQARLAASVAALERAQQRLAELVRGPRAEWIAEAEARMEGAGENLDAQRREYDRVRVLVDDGLLSPSMLDTAFARRELAEADFEGAEARLQEFLEGTTPEELAQARAAVDEASATIDALRITVSRLAVHAPTAGIIEVLPYEPGERPAAGAVVATLLVDAAPYARIYVPEPVRARVTPGLAAVVRTDGIDTEFAGTVRFVSSEAAFTPYFALTQRDRSRLSYLAEVTLTGEAATGLPTGIPVEVDFPTLRE